MSGREAVKFGKIGKKGGYMAVIVLPHPPRRLGKSPTMPYFINTNLPSSLSPIIENFLRTRWFVWLS